MHLLSEEDLTTVALSQMFYYAESIIKFSPRSQDFWVEGLRDKIECGRMLLIHVGDWLFYCYLYIDSIFSFKVLYIQTPIQIIRSNLYFRETILEDYSIYSIPLVI